MTNPPEYPFQGREATPALNPPFIAANLILDENARTLKILQDLFEQAIWKDFSLK